ncbi:glucokinase [Leeia sp.]|uniref:glucokinase n=1 Tax=Leeia sp. TaxID=2884678 RepID=UPI0035B4DC52
MPLEQPWLIADIGGTNARFALYRPASGFASPQVLPTSEHATLQAAAEHYLQQLGLTEPAVRPRYAAFGIANPITSDWVQMTNHSWQFSISELQSALGLDKLLMLNDFSALALALPHLQAAELQQVGGGVPVPHEAMALIGPGTGLGVSGLLPDGHGGWLALAGEGGHVTLAPFDAFERAVVDYVQARHPHVSAERLLCGGGAGQDMGLPLLHEAVCAVQARPQQARTAAEITRLGVVGEDAACRLTVDLFCAMLGTMAANLVLSLGARGGCFIGGGIVPRLGSYFAQSPFRRRFEEKGRCSAYLQQVPTYVIHAEYPAFTGAAAALAQWLQTHRQT